jgi:molybdate transport system substrate-binding protein
MAKIKLFCSNSLRGALTDLIPLFERSSGHHVELSYDPAKVMMERIGRGETADAVIIGGDAIEQLVQQGKLTAASRRPFASCGIGVAVRAGSARPDIGSVDAFKRALLAAKSIAWTQQGASGIYFSGLIERLGIAKEIRAKAAQQPGGLIAEQLVDGRADLAIQQIPELMAVPGAELVGPLPAEIQQVTASSAGIFTGSRNAKPAEELLSFLTSPSSKAVLKAKGLEPAT